MKYKLIIICISIFIASPIDVISTLNIATPGMTEVRVISNSLNHDSLSMSQKEFTADVVETDVPTLNQTIVVLVTPMGTNGEISWDKFQSHVERLYENGLRIYITNGGTGQIESLTPEEQGQVTAFVKKTLDACGDDYILGVGTGAGITKNVIKQTKKAEQQGAHFAMIRPPSAISLQDYEIMQYYQDIIEATENIPIMLYAPDTKLTPEMIGDLAKQYDRIMWVKEATGDISRVSEINKAAEGHIVVVCGSDVIAFQMAVEYGVSAWVSPPANMFPNACLLLYRLIAEGAIEEASKLNDHLKPLFALFETGIYVQGAMKGLQLLGFPYGPPRKPRTELEGEPLRELEKIVTKLERLGIEKTARGRMNELDRSL